MHESITRKMSFAFDLSWYHRLHAIMVLHARYGRCPGGGYLTRKVTGCGDRKSKIFHHVRKFFPSFRQKGHKFSRCQFICHPYARTYRPLNSYPQLLLVRFQNMLLSYQTPHGKNRRQTRAAGKTFFWAATNNSRALCSPYVALMCNRDFCVSREVSTISLVSQKTLSLANLRLRSGSATLCKYWLSVMF